jgi:arsenate reductase (thioredoxin)
MLYEYVWVPGPKNMDLLNSLELPPGFVENYVWSFVKQIKVASNSRYESAYFCHAKKCNGWILGEPLENEEHTILAGRDGTAYDCYDVVRKFASFAGSHKETMKQNSMIVFVCEHGAAKSIIAASYFNRLAREKNLSLHAVARGTHPDAELSVNGVAGLREDGLTPTESIPTSLTWEDIESAQHIVSFCDLPEEYHQKTIVEHWRDIPPVSENYGQSRDAIVARLQKLIDDL